LAIDLASQILVVAAARASGESSWLADSLGSIVARPAAMIVQVAEWSRGRKSSMRYHVGDP
jgi:hypothetical protein